MVLNNCKKRICVLNVVIIMMLNGCAKNPDLSTLTSPLTETISEESEMTTFEESTYSSSIQEVRLLLEADVAFEEIFSEYRLSTDKKPKLMIPIVDNAMFEKYQQLLSVDLPSINFDNESLIISYGSALKNIIVITEDHPLDGIKSKVGPEFEEVYSDSKVFCYATEKIMWDREYYLEY